MTSTSSTSPTPDSKSVRGALVLGALGAAVAALAVYQWAELVAVRHGAKALCSLNSTVNCETVWTSAFAVHVHHWLGVPVAGLGLVWGLTAVALAVRCALWAQKGAPTEMERVALRLMAGVGVFACVGLGVASFSSGALCLTCLGTYVLVLAYAASAFWLLPHPSTKTATQSLRPAALWIGGLTALFFVPVLVLGLQTPQASAAGLAGPLPKGPDVASNPATVPSAEVQLKNVLAQMGAPEKQALSDALAAYRGTAVPMPALSYTTRQLLGDASAPVHVAEFTDVRCSHCRHLSETLHQLRTVLPPGLLAVESRHFPLDGECNPLMTQSSHTGISCAGAKAEICLEGAPDYLQLQEKIFEDQQTLTKDKVIELASSGSVSRDKLLACMENPDTNRKLEDDVHYAAVYHLEGTPLVLINGREASPMPSFLYVMALARGDANSPAFSDLPPAAPPRASAP